MTHPRSAVSAVSRLAASVMLRMAAKADALKQRAYFRPRGIARPFDAGPGAESRIRVLSSLNMTPCTSVCFGYSLKGIDIMYIRVGVDVSMPCEPSSTRKHRKLKQTTLDL